MFDLRYFRDLWICLSLLCYFIYIFCRSSCQKQPPEVFCKKRVFLKILQIFVAPTEVFSCEICEIFKNTFFEANRQTTIHRCSIKSFSDKFHQILETTPVTGPFLESGNFANKDRHYICFPSSFTTFFRTPLLPNIFAVPLLRITIHIAFNQSVTNEIFIPLSCTLRDRLLASRNCMKFCHLES